MISNVANATNPTGNSERSRVEGAGCVAEQWTVTVTNFTVVENEDVGAADREEEP